ncbi:MAG: transposase [Cyanophyceae cyanobacterium]
MKEKLRSIFESKITGEEGESQIVTGLKDALRVSTDVITTIQNHLQGICQYWVNCVTNGSMEGINKRYEFTNITNFRARLLAAFRP